MSKLTHELLSKIPYRRGNAINPKYIFVGMAPGKDEFIHPEHLAFVGYSGQLLNNKLIATANIPMSECYFTNVLKERIHNDKDEEWIKDHPQAYATYLELLRAELELVGKDANIIIPLGDVALKAVCGVSGIMKYQGSIIKSSIIPNKKCIPTLHPAAILRNWSALVYTKHYFKRIKEEAQSPTINLPKRTYIIRPSFDTAVEYLNKYLNSPNLISVDTETLKNIRPNRIATIQFADSKDLGFCLPLQHKNRKPWWTIKEEMILWRMVYNILTQKNLIGQNFVVFDAFMLHFTGIPYTKVLPQVHIDLCEAMRCLEPELPADLGFFTSIFTREPYYKDEGKGWGSRESEDEFFIYGCKDVCIPCEIAPQLEEMLKSENLWEFYREHFLRYALHRMDCSVRGLPVDLELRKELDLEFTKDIIETQCKLTILAGEKINVKSTPDMRRLLYTTLKLPKVYNKKGNLSTDEDAILRHSTKMESDIFPLILKQRSLRTLKSSNLDVRLDSDDHIRSSFGWTETHRLTSGGVPFQTGTNLANWKKSMRRMIRAPKGYKICKGDLSQAEARIVAWRGRMLKSIELFLDPTRDIHRETAADANRIPLEMVTDEQRYRAKRIRYGVNYDMHALRFAATYNKDASKINMPFITRKIAQVLLDQFHEANPELREIYHKEIRDEVSRTSTLHNCFGARMRFQQRRGDELFRSAYSWYAQSIVAYLINLIWDKARDKGIYVIHQNHDELVWLSLIEKVKQDCEFMHNAAQVHMDICALSDVPPLIIPFEIEVGDNWYKTEEWKHTKVA